MKIFRQFGIIIAIWMVGELISRGFKIPIPGSVIGMVLLLVLLSLEIIKLDMLKELSDFLLGNLAFFFIPAGVGVLGSFDLLKNMWLKLLLIIVVTTIIVMASTGIIVQFITKKR